MIERGGRGQLKGIPDQVPPGAVHSLKPRQKGVSGPWSHLHRRGTHTNNDGCRGAEWVWKGSVGGREALGWAGKEAECFRETLTCLWGEGRNTPG